jgi:hypothetical protein
LPIPVGSWKVLMPCFAAMGKSEGMGRHKSLLGV